MPKSKFNLFDSYFFWPWIFASGALTLLLATAGRYGIFTDELYFVSCAEHLGLGYVDHPPFVAWITRFGMLFGKSLPVLRIFPALACLGTVMAAALISRALGGSGFSASVSSLSILCGMAFWIMFGYVSMNAYDIFFVTLASWLFIRCLQDGSARLWIFLGLIIGLGLNTKMTMWVFAFSLLAGVLMTGQRRLFLTRYPYYSLTIAIALFLPYLVWQAANGFPTIEFIRNAGGKNLSLPFHTLLGQLIMSTNPLLFPLWMTGIITLLGSRRSRHLLSLGLAAVLFFVFFLSNHSKFYYLLPVIPLLVSVGSVPFGQWMKRGAGWAGVTWTALLVLSGLVMLPFGLPLLPIDSFVSYARRLDITGKIRTEHHEAKLIPGYFGQRFGWKEFTRTVADVYHALPDSDRVRCGILGFHYGESGAIDYFGPSMGLPKAIGRHNSWWLWGPGYYTGDVMIAAVSGSATVDPYFRMAELRAVYTFPYIDGTFQDHRIYVCRDPVEAMPVLWQKLRTYD